jgi:hypothetical protein
MNLSAGCRHLGFSDKRQVASIILLVCLSTVSQLGGQGGQDGLRFLGKPFCCLH